MRKHFLLVFLLALLPLIGWGQTVNWKSGASTEEIPYGETPAFQNLIDVACSYDASPCVFHEESSNYPTGNNQYNWRVVTEDNGNTPATSLNVGTTYYLRVSVHHRTSNTGYSNDRKWLPFKIVKADVDVLLYSFNLPYGTATPTTGADMPSGSYSVTGATWDDVKNSLTFNQIEPGTDCGVNYAYTLTAGTNANYNITVIPNGAQLSFTKINGTLVAPTAATPTYDDGKDVVLINAGSYEGTVEYRITAPAGKETDWTDDINLIVGQAVTDGAYTVEYRAVGDVNHNDLAGGSISATIAKRAIDATDYTLPTAVPDLVYTEPIPNNVSSDPTAQGWDLHTPLVWKDGVARGTVEYWRNDVNNWATNIRWRDVAGNWTIRTHIIPDGNHTINGGTAAYTVSTEDLPVSIAPATLTPVTIPADIIASDLKYTGSDLELLTAALPLPQFNGANVAGTYTYYVDGTSVGTDWQDVVGQDADVVTDAYVLTYTFNATSNNFVDITTPQEIGNANIAKGENEITDDPVMTAVTFNTVPTVATDAKATFGTPTYTFSQSATEGFEAAGAITVWDAGTWYVKSDVEGTDNYEAATKTTSFEIAKATLNFGVNGLEVDWADGTTYTWAEIVSQLINSDDWLLGESDEEKADILAAGLDITVNGAAAAAGNEAYENLLAGDAGTYNIEFATVPDADINYAITLWNNKVNVIINTVDATLAELADANKTYNGGEQELVTITKAAVGAAAENGVLYIVGGDTAPEANSEAWTAGIPKEINANTYKVWQKVVGDKNHNDVVATAPVTGTIAPKAIKDAVFTIDPATSAYTGLNQNTTVITVVPDDAEPMDVDEDIKSITLPADVTTFGEYDVTIEGQGNYTGTTTKKFSISQAENNAVVTIEGWTYGEYDAEVNAPVLTAAFGAETVQYTYSVKDADDWKDEIPTDFGDYTVKATIAETADYAGVVATENFSIAKANVTDIVAPAAISRTFNGEDQILVEAAKFNDGVKKGDFTYAVVAKGATPADEDYAAALPTGFNAGKYDIYTKFTPDINHNAKDVTPNPVTAEIKQAIVGYALSNLTKTWDGEKIEGDDLNKLFTPISGEQLFGDDVYNVPFEFVLPEDYRDYGTYSFTQADYKYKAGKPENYDVRFSGTANIVINKADIVVPNEEAGIEGDFVAPTAAELTYNGTERELLDAGEVTTTYQYEDIMDKPELIGTMKYATAENGDYTTAIPKATDAGTYAVWYKVEGDKNHNDTQATKIEVTIGKKALASTMFALSATTAEYKKDNLMPTVTATDLNDEKTNIIKASDYVVKAYDSENNEVEGNKLINVGTYTLKFTPSEKSNYSDGNAQATFEITPRPAQAVAYNATKVYDGVAGLGEIKVKFSYTNLIPGDDDAIVAGDGAVYFEKEAKNAGSYPMLFNLDGFVSQNYEVIGVEDTGAQFTITKAPLTVKWKAGAAGFSKAYGEDDPEFDATADNIVLQGAIAGEEATIIDNTVISRVDENENVGKYDLQLSALQIKDEKDQWVDAHVFDNYNYNFENPIKQIFEIVPADIAVSVVPQSKTYDGVKVTTFDVTAEDLVVTHLKGGEAKNVVFTTLPTATVTGGAENAGEYEVTLAGGVATNYNIKTYLTSTYTIDPVMVNAQFNNTPVAVEGDEVSVILGKVQWTVKADKEANQSIVDDNIGKFNLYYQGLVETKNKVDYIAEGEDGQDALILVYEGEENPANFEFINATGDLNIGEAGIAVALDDSKAIETTAANKANVTFTQNRPVAEDTWQACVLPFTVSIEKLSDTFGYAAVDLFDKDRTNENEVHFSLQVSGSIEAGTPFLFKTNNNTNFTDVMFEGVDVVSTASLDANRIVVDDKGDGADATGIKFIGTFEKVGIWGEDFRYLSGGTWYNAAKYDKDKPANIKPLRAYLDMNGNASARIFIDEPDGTTSIMSVSNFNNMMNEGWYTIEGKKLDQAPTQKGVYIQNGKKVVIK